MNKSGEIQTPVEEESTKQLNEYSERGGQLAKQSTMLSKKDELSSSEVVVEAENPEQFEKLSRWFDILKQVCQEKPRVVLKALQNPDRLVQTDPEDQITARAEKLRWKIKGREQIKKQFEENGVDAQKALAVIDYLRDNVKYTEYLKNKSGDYVNTARTYQYQETDFGLIVELIEIDDNPVNLLEKLGGIINYQDGNRFSLKKLVDYCKLTNSNPRAEEILVKIKDLENLDKLGINNLFFVGDHDEGIKAFFGREGDQRSIVDPIQSLSGLDENSFKELLSEKNLIKAQELWAKITGEETIKIQFLPHLLKLANNPQLELAFFTFLNNGGYASKRLREDIQGEYNSYKLDWSIQRLEKIYEEIPEVFDLLRDGFDVDFVFDIRDFDNYEKTINIDGILNRKEDFLKLYNNQQLRENAKILHKYGLKMQTSRKDHDFYDYVMTSDPEQLEKSIIIYKLVGKIFAKQSTNPSMTLEKFWLWEGIADKLDNLSIDQVTEAFQLLADKTDELADFNMDISQLLTDLDSEEALKKRIEQILDPKIREFVGDPLFTKWLAKYGKSWATFFEDSDSYLELYKYKDQLFKRLEELSVHGSGFIDRNLETFNYILGLPEKELADLQEELTNLSLRLKIDRDLLLKVKLLKDVDLPQKEFLFKSLGLDNIQALYNREGLDPKSLETYFSLSEEDQKELFDLAAQIKNRYNFSIRDTKHPYKIQLQLFCQLVSNKEYREELFQDIDALKKESLDEKYDPVVPNRANFWQDNTQFLVLMKELTWSTDDFDQFRRVVQNQDSKKSLEYFDFASLKSLTETIGLNQNNLYYTRVEGLSYVLDNLQDDNYTSFFRKILNQKPTSFNSCTSAFSLIDSKIVNRVVSEPLYVEKLLGAIEEFGNITPTLVTEYILNPNEQERAEYREKVLKFREDVHHNVPIMPLTEGIGGEDFLVDMIALTYPGTDFAEIKKYLSQLQDQCEDVQNLHIREEGYFGKIVSREKTAELRDPQNEVDEDLLSLVKKIVVEKNENSTVIEEEDADLAFKAWARLLVDAGSTDQKKLFSDNLDEVVACCRIALGDEIADFRQQMAGDTSQNSAKLNFLNKAGELFGEYYKDNSSQVIESFLSQHQVQLNTLLNRLTDKRLRALENNIVNSKKISEENRANFKKIIDGLRDQQLSETERRQHFAKLLAYLTDRSIFSGSIGLRNKVAKENKKIVLRDKEGQEVDPHLLIRGFVSKNASSFFAKTTAGECTAGDLDLFRRKDHFHVNLVNNEGIVVGNIQAYQLENNGKPALIFRGFNPSRSLITAENSAVLCDQMLDIVKQIAADNNIDQIMIPTQTDWHPLTNRNDEGVDRYFEGKFAKLENKVDLSFIVARDKQINTFYRIT